MLSFENYYCIVYNLYKLNIFKERNRRDENLKQTLYIICLYYILKSILLNNDKIIEKQIRMTNDLSSDSSWS